MIRPATIDAEIEQIARPTSLADAEERLAAFTQRFGFDHAVHVILSSWSSGDGTDVFVTTYPKIWIDRYFERGYSEIDPVLRMARVSPAPFHWADVADETPEVRAFFDDAAAMGVGSQGFSLPISGPDGEVGLFSVTSSLEEGAWRETCERMLPFLQILGFEFHRGLGKLCRGEVQRDRIAALSPRERDVLRWAAAGKTIWETSVLLGLSEQTAQTYMRDAIRRLGCINKTHAVAEAVRRALI
jgi:DNA-binding CsgD family transcriptional regulator